METIEFLNIEFLGNSIKDYLFFLLVLIIGFFVIIPVKSLIMRLLSNLFGKNQNDTDTQKFKNLLNTPLQYFLLLILLFFSVKFINIPDFAVTDNDSFDFGSLISKGFKRNSLIINLGGGMISDLGGFVSSIYMRGIDFVNIPTTLLGMVDASIGGKTGIDLNDLKNIIGSFEFAKIIIIDLNFLSTLPIRQLNSGFAEMIKHSLIDSKKHWNKISSVNFSKDVDSSLIYNSIMTKIKIIENDPKESSSRKFLNFGHTIGHAIESFLLNSDREILHGEAILIGIILESYLSQKLLNFDTQLTLNIKNYILKFSKQIDFSEEDIKHVIEFLKYDKKNISDEPLFVLLNEIGKPSYDNKVSNEEIIEAFKFYAV